MRFSKRLSSLMVVTSPGQPDPLDVVRECHSPLIAHLCNVCATIVWPLRELSVTSCLQPAWRPAVLYYCIVSRWRLCLQTGQAARKTTPSPPLVWSGKLL